MFNFIFSTFVLFVRLFIWQGRDPQKARERDDGFMQKMSQRGRVWINDANLMTCAHDAYLRFSENGRLGWFYKMGLVRDLVLGKVAFTTGGYQVTYLKGMKLFAQYDFESRVVGWNDRWLIFEHRCLQGGKLTFVGLTKQSCFYGGKKLSPSAFLAKCGWVDVQENLVPAEIESWLGAEADVITAIKNSEQNKTQ